MSIHFTCLIYKLFSLRYSLWSTIVNELINGLVERPHPVNWTVPMVCNSSCQITWIMQSYYEFIIQFSSYIIYIITCLRCMWRTTSFNIEENGNMSTSWCQWLIQYNREKKTICLDLTSASSSIHANDD
jgi:hypothetical protein